MQKIINLWAAVALVAAFATAITVLVLWIRGFSSRPVPSDLEASVAMKLYDSSIPNKYQKMANPISGSRLDLIDAGGHYEEHCAVYHGDDGEGQPKFHGSCIHDPLTSDQKTRRRCLTASSIGLSRTACAGPACRHSESREIRMNMHGR